MNDIATNYYFGGYYLTKLRPKGYGSGLGNLIYTCSECINDPLLDTWSYSWATDNNKQIDEIKSNFKLSENQIDKIRNWVNDKIQDNKIGFLNVFQDLETALDYKSRFFIHLSDIKIFALYFDANEKEAILKEFRPQSETMREIGLRLTLLKEILEPENEIVLGYDYIGIEIDGSFHSFHCHDIGRELAGKFGLVLNEYGLFDSNLNSKQVLDYLNDEKNGCEPVPWFIVKTKLVRDV
ncbi:hypothetical protein A8C56_20775 [Niabella ginsenosidivorans]|uniref:Uncharacterized protein n=1 Tax=Niabella ginsenosidivorans TaxID=1176587 RepID=A0A1A9I8Q1_9BACT|nr:hypothetical protein [Niabella ginsenosidivorans]ANH83090.1 hypothetical protein A8C56_20775 [Niabella ginsenosidivorans]